jgi:hypothetical protein
VQSDIVYLVDCDPQALELAKENVDVLLEEELIGRSSEDEEGCIGVELIMAKVQINPQRKCSKGRGGRGSHNGWDKKGNGRGKKCCSTAVQYNDVHDCETNNDVDDGIPLSSNIVDTVITK